MNKFLMFIYPFLVASFVALCCGFLWNLGASDAGLPSVSMVSALNFFWLATLLVTWFTRIAKSAWNSNPAPEENVEKKVINPLDNE